MSVSYGCWPRSRLTDLEARRDWEMLSVLGLLGEGDREEDDDRWWSPRERDGWGEGQSLEGWRDLRRWDEDRRGGDGEGRPAGLLVMPAPKDRREGAGLLRYLRGGDGEGERSRRQWPGEREVQGWRERWERCRPSDELLSLDLSRPSRRERLAVGEWWRLGEEESGDVWGWRSLGLERSPEDLSRELLWLRESLPARFVPDLCWARDASRSPEGLSCRSALGPMFPWETAGPAVDWGGASPCNCCQYSRMSSKNSAFQSWTISCVGPWGMFPASCGVWGGAVTFVLDVGAIGTKGGVGPWKNPRKCRGVGEVFLGSDEDDGGGRGGKGPEAGGPPERAAGPGRRTGPVDDVRRAWPRTCGVGTAGPRPGQVQGEGGGT